MLWQKHSYYKAFLTIQGKMGLFDLKIQSGRAEQNKKPQPFYGLRHCV
jgi:hypothetical protein